MNKLSEIYNKVVEKESNRFDVGNEDLMCMGVSTGADWALDTITPQVAISFGEFLSIFFMGGNPTMEQKFKEFLKQYKP